MIQGNRNGIPQVKLINISREIFSSEAGIESWNSSSLDLRAAISPS